MGLLNDSGNYKTVIDTMDIWAKAENISGLNTPAGNFDCIKYTNKFEKNTPNIDIFPDKLDPFIIEYYVPDFGLVRAEYYSISLSGGTPYRSALYELVSQNITGGGCLEQLITDKDFGDIPGGAQKTLQIDNILINKTADTIKVQSININGGEVLLTNPTDYSQTILPGNSLNLTLTASQIKFGNFTSYITIQTTCGEYTLTVKGKGV